LSKVGGVARNDLEGARTQAAAAQSDLDQAQAQVRRLQTGPSAGLSYRVALAQQDIAAAQTGVAQARQSVTMAQRARTETLAVAEQDIRAAKAAVEQARAGEAGAHDAAQLTLLTSPQSGIATGVIARVGETAQPGATLITITATTGDHIEALATARQLPALRVGQSAHVILDTRPGTAIAARITSIARVAEPDGRSFRIKLALLHLPAGLRPGQTARVNLTLR
jgi:HlyD family secretion protein